MVRLAFDLARALDPVAVAALTAHPEALVVVSGRLLGLEEGP
jgi:hypothetical protein